jgi:CysZ protein
MAGVGPIGAESTVPEKTDPGCARRRWRGVPQGMRWWTRGLAGALAPWRGLRYLAGRPGLWPWLAAPVVGFVVVLVPTAWWTWASFPTWIAGIAPPPDVDVLAGVWWLAVRVLSVVVFVGLAAVEWVVVSAVTRPAYGVVTERVEDEIAGVEAAFDLPALLGDAGWSVVHSLLALAVYVAVSVVISAVALVPGVGEVVAPLLWTGASVLWLARELVDGPLSRRQLGFAAKLAFVRDHLPEMTGLGLVTAAALTVPIVDLVVLPAAFVGATLWYVESRSAPVWTA